MKILNMVILQYGYDSLVGTLKWMRNYSIRASGRQFVKKYLGDLQFGGVDAETLFLKCYELRNKLLRGQQPFADWKEVNNVVASLEQMVSKLLAGKLSRKNISDVEESGKNF